MGVQVDNLYLHADGGYYCLLSSDAPMKCPVTGKWLDGVIYAGSEDQKMRSTTLERFSDRFTAVADYTGDDEQVLQMIRRCNPGESDLDFVRVFEAWHESEMGVTGHMLELAVGATLLKTYDKLCPTEVSYQELTITTEDLQQVVQNYEIERVPQPHGFKFVMRKSFPDSA